MLVLFALAALVAGCALLMDGSNRLRTARHSLRNFRRLEIAEQFELVVGTACLAAFAVLLIAAVVNH